MTFVPPNQIPTAPLEGPCQAWTDIAGVRAACNLLATEADDAAVQFGIDLASLVLWTAMGSRYGLCRHTMRPCWEGDHNGAFGASDRRRDAADYPDYIPSVDGQVQSTGVWLDRGAWSCSCHLPSLTLPGPLAAVESVQVDGVALPLAGFKIKTLGHGARRHLLRVDGDVWPCCNDLNEDPTVVPAQAGGCPAWAVTYWQGRAINSTTKAMAEILAEQFAKIRCNKSCDGVNSGLTRVARRGVVKEFTKSDLKGGIETGHPLVDPWITAVNPHRQIRRAAVVRADDPGRRRLWSWVDAA